MTFLVYFFDREGRYGEPAEISTQEAVIYVKKQLRLENPPYEIRVTTNDKEDTVLHVINGELIFPKQKDLERYLFGK